MNALETFGEFVCRKRRERNISLRAFAKSINLSLSYWADIEKDRKYPPKGDMLYDIANHLCLTDTERNLMLDLAGNSRMSIAPDVIDYISENEYIVDVIRRAKKSGFTAEDWYEFFEYIHQKKEKEFYEKR